MSRRTPQNGLSLPSRDYYIDKDIETDANLLALRSLITSTLQRVGEFPAGAAGATVAEAEALRIVKLEQRLAQEMATAEALRDPQGTYNKLPTASGLSAAPLLADAKAIPHRALPCTDGVRAACVARLATF